MKKILLLLLLLLNVHGLLFDGQWLTGTQAVAQERKRVVQNKPYIDLRPFHYGFSFGLHQQSIIMPNSGYVDPETGQQWWVSNDNFSPGFTVGLLGEWRVNQYLGLRLQPTMHFASKHITFREQTTGLTDHQDMKSTYIVLPLNLKIAAPRHNNYRPYVITGVNAMYNLTTKDQANIATKPLSFNVEVGFGCDYYLPFFKFCPELKFCFGLKNILESKRTDLTDPLLLKYSQSLDKAQSAMIVLTLYFE